MDQLLPIMWLLPISLSFLFIRSAHGVSCVPNELQHKDSIAPSLTISVVEFPGENVLPIGYNITLVCTSKASNVNYGLHFYRQPYWIQFYFNHNFRSFKECGGGDGDVDSEDIKVCTYSIQSSSKNNSGNYTCWAYNQISCTKGTLKLEFREPSQPVFTVEPPNEINVTSGSKLSINCTASGIPIPVVKWYKDGSPVFQGKTAKTMGSLFLTVDSVTAAHQGKYWCEAQNLKGWKRSSSTIVKLEPTLEIDQLPVFYHHPKSVTVSLGDEVVFWCAAKGSPAPEIIWLKDGMINTREKVTVFQGKEITYVVLNISVVKSESRGHYACQATNAIGSIISKEAALLITDETSSTSNSTSDSNIVWILIVIATVILVLLVISILLIHKKCRKPSLEDNRQMNARSQFPHLHLQRNNIHQQLRNSNAYVDSTHLSRTANITMENEG